MNTIIIPTDFSKASEKAIEFVIEIAQRTEASILLLHSVFIPAMDINVPADLVQDMYKTEEEESEKKLIILCKKIHAFKYKNGHHLSCDYVSHHNVPAVEIESIAEEYKADLVIMGTKGRDNLWGFLGSTTMESLKNLDCSVLIVKESSTWNDFRKVSCAIETINEDLFQLKAVIPLLKEFNSETTVLHIEKHAKSADDLEMIIERKEEGENFMAAFSETTNYRNISYRSLLGNDPSEGIVDFIEKNRSDLLVLIKYKRNWFENLFHSSVTKKIISDLNIPVLVIHKK
jgi:nucleotide-binding universal stress UspA family protein